MTDLDKLIEAVEGGTWEPHSPAGAYMSRCIPTHEDIPTRKHAKYAYHGSLDAAKALHEALLPGWVFVVSDGSASVLEKGNGFATMEKHYCDNPARAWLIAILKAHRGSNTDS